MSPVALIPRRAPTADPAACPLDPLGSSAPSRPAASTRRAARTARRRPAFYRGGGGRFPERQGRSAAQPRRPGHPAPAHGRLACRPAARGAHAQGRPRSRRSRGNVHREPSARDRLPRDRAAACTAARDPGVPATHVGPSAAVGTTLRRRHPEPELGRDPPPARSGQPLCRPARRPARVVPLPPPIRRVAATPAGRGRAGAGSGPAPTGERLVPGFGVSRGSHPPWHRRWRGRRGRRVDRPPLDLLRRPLADRDRAKLAPRPSRRGRACGPGLDAGVRLDRPVVRGASRGGPLARHRRPDPLPRAVGRRDTVAGAGDRRPACRQRVPRRGSETGRRPPDARTATRPGQPLAPDRVLGRSATASTSPARRWRRRPRWRRRSASAGPRRSGPP